MSNDFIIHPQNCSQLASRDRIHFVLCFPRVRTEPLCCMVCAEVTLPNKLITEELGSSVEKRERGKEKGQNEYTDSKQAERLQAGVRSRRAEHGRSEFDRMIADS